MLRSNVLFRLVTPPLFASPGRNSAWPCMIFGITAQDVCVHGAKNPKDCRSRISFTLLVPGSFLSRWSRLADRSLMKWLLPILRFLIAGALGRDWRARFRSPGARGEESTVVAGWRLWARARQRCILMVALKPLCRALCIFIPGHPWLRRL